MKSQPATTANREHRRSEVLHQLCLQIELSRDKGMTLRQAIRLARKRRHSALGNKGRLSQGGMIRHFYRWRHQRTAAVFVRSYLPMQPVIPLALVDEFLNRLVADRLVRAATVMASLRSDWQMGKSLPGLGTWREYWQRKHGVSALRSVPPAFPVGRSTFYAYLATLSPADYHRRITVALRAQRELERFFSFIESRRNALAAKRRHEPLGAQTPLQT